jgi:hypothetical protein
MNSLMQEWIRETEPGLEIDRWRRRFTDPRVRPECLMTDAEREALAVFPDRIRVFRGAIRGVNEQGLSWGLTRERASSWAHESVGKHGVGQAVVVVGHLRRERVIAYTDARSEDEIIALPEDLSNVEIAPAGPDPREELVKVKRPEFHGGVQSADDPERLP